MSTTTTRWRRGSVLAAVAAVLAAGMVTVAAIMLTVPGAQQRGGSGGVDLAGNTVQLDGPPPAPAASAAPSGHGRFAAPSVGLDVPLGALDVVDGVIEPPGFTSAYWVRNLGVDPTAPASGTVFVAMHSLRAGGLGPGNALIDVAHARARIAVGAPITVDGTTYRVTRTETVTKQDIRSDAGVWADVPGRLVVVTCLQRPDGRRSVDNVVIEATRG
ncbi:class F sortase [Curtobacterium sp. VKM Ac-2922]|uniref:class F sortase n=1 Tax=Curtobacterium sp. VKM Ac-2922 TaxID=2929475 RepID=UPI001FB1BB4A|nr:class F sortase [Curtobacterium sp. VKM Ac-2922]MCJ1714909.1 class F sortase [Curtobacterium sp. VKM Ac-2922]